VVVAGNYVHDNGEAEKAPNRTAEWSAFGNGIVLAGARDSVVRNNLIVNNKTSGVLVVSMLDASLWPSGGNQVLDNVIRGSGRSDLALGGPVEQGSCFSGNDARTTTPMLLKVLHSCNGINIQMPYGLAASSDNLGRIAQVKHGQNTILDHGDAPKPELTFDQIPGGSQAPVRPAVDVLAGSGFDPASITTPAMPEGITFDSRRPVIFSIPFDSGFWPVFMGIILWIVPMGLWLIGGLWALWSIWRRSERRTMSKLWWSLIVLAVPMIGLFAYLAMGHKSWRARVRWLAGAGGFAGWIVVVVGALVMGKIF
jgi:hypothetical protein